MKTIKVLFEAGPMVDSKKTGVGYYVNHMVRAIADYGKDTLELEGYLFNFLGRNTNHIPSIKHVAFHTIRLIPGKLLSVCRRFNFQPLLELFTWHSGDILVFTNYVMLPTLRKQKKALVIYDLSFLDHPEYMQSVNLAYLQHFCSPSIRRADLIITISDFTKDRLLAHFPELSCPIVVTPIPPAPLATTPIPPINQRLSDLGIQNDAYLLYLGTIEPRKNIQGLIRAYALMNEEVRASYALVLAGGKGWKDEAILAEITELQNAGIRIILTGYVDDAEKAALYAHSRGFVLPSHYEGFGMPILEAMQYDIPVAVSNIPVFHEVAGQAALYFDQNDPTSMACVLETLVQDEAQRQKLLPLGSAQLALFSWSANAETLVSSLRAIIHK